MELDGELAIGFAGGGVSGGVVVYEDKRVSRRTKHGSKDVPRVCDAFVDGPAGDLLDAHELVAGIQ